MEERRSIGVTVFGIVLLLLTTWYTVLFISDIIDPDSEMLTSDIVGPFFIIIALILLSIGILKLKNWARIVCLWLTWLFGISFIFLGMSAGVALSSEPDNVVILKIAFLAIIICAPIIFYLTCPKVKEQFK